MAMSDYLFDSDGCLGDFVGHVADEAAKVGIELPRQPATYNYLDEISLLDRGRVNEVLREPGFWATMPVYPGVREGLDAIQSAGHTVHVVSSPWMSCPGWDFARRHWLMRNFDLEPSALMAVHKKKKHLVCGDVFIEDSVENLAAWSAKWPGRPAFLVPRSYNCLEADKWLTLDWSQESVDLLLRGLRAQGR